ncbi:MAG TPA: apolipoprotein N-acyltransferase [Terracidiphilus sp.]|nr:apolipoprotein N-acyltransferase [Terracidiphilus sp.]
MQHKSWMSWAAAVLSAGLLELPFPLAGPMPPWRSIFAWFALAPLIWGVLRAAESGKRPLRRGFLIAYVCGVLWYAGNCYWIYDTMLIHGGLPPAISVLILLLFSLVLGGYFGLFGLFIALLRRRLGVGWALIAAPFLWAALELAAARVTSVPWDQLGYSQVDNRFMAALAPWTGAYGVSFVLVAVNAAWVASLGGQFGFGERGLRGTLQTVALCLGIGVLASGSFHGALQDAPTTATAILIQPNLDVDTTGYWLGPGEWDQHMADFRRFAAEQCNTYIAGIPQTGAPTAETACTPNPAPPDLVAWPESPAPFFEQEPRFKSAMSAIARASGAPLIVNGIGSDFDAAAGASVDHVSAMVYSADGNQTGRYDKIHLVPWGEYVPFPKLFFFARKLTGKVSNFTPGTVRTVFHVQSANGQMHRYGIFICYEAVFADEVRQFARNGAEVFVNLSDDGWYGDTSAPWQHLNMARMRAIENRRWILRDTNDGVTAAIDPYGRVRQSIPRHKADVLPAQFGFRDDVTFYTEHGDVFAWLCTAVAVVLLAGALSRLQLKLK